MTPELRARLPEYVLGVLPEEARAAIEAALAASPELQREVDALAEQLAARSEILPRIAPEPATRARLLATLGGVERFAPFFPLLCDLFDLPRAAIRAILTRVDDLTAPWEPHLFGTPLEGIELTHFRAGPRLAGAAGGLVRLRPNVSFPRHQHRGDEVSVVLEGGLREGGRIHGPGAIVERKRDTVHDFAATGERDLVVIVLHRGIALV
jgi:putative transcriptional regulator